MSRLFPRKLLPRPHTIPRFVVGRPCPLCHNPILLLWQPLDDGSFKPVAIDPHSWAGETIFLPDHFIPHASHCDLQRHHFDSVKTVPRETPSKEQPGE